MDSLNEIIIYNPDETIKIEVRLEEDTVWLTQSQLTELFQKNVSTISRHINNIFKEGELERESNLRFLQIAHSDKPVMFYNLDVIISVGYRIKSQRGVQFRQWANKILKEYLLKGYSMNQRLTDIENRVDHKLSAHEHRLDQIDKKIDFFVRTSLPPVEGIFYNGQIFDAYVFASNLIKSAHESIILIDNYVDETVLTLLDKRQQDVKADIYTSHINRKLGLDLELHNSQYPPIGLHLYTQAHDRFLIIDNVVFHIGASLKDLGKKLFAFSQMSLPADAILQRL